MTNDPGTERTIGRRGTARAAPAAAPPRAPRRPPPAARCNSRAEQITGPATPAAADGTTGRSRIRLRRTAAAAEGRAGRPTFQPAVRPVAAAAAAATAAAAGPHWPLLRPAGRRLGRRRAGLYHAKLRVARCVQRYSANLPPRGCVLRAASISRAPAPRPARARAVTRACHADRTSWRPRNSGPATALSHANRHALINTWQAPRALHGVLRAGSRSTVRHTGRGASAVQIGRASRRVCRHQLARTQKHAELCVSV